MSVLLYGSAARGQHRGVESAVDLLVVLSLVVTTETEYRAGGLFLAHVRRDAQALYG